MHLYKCPDTCHNISVYHRLYLLSTKTFMEKTKTFPGIVQLGYPKYCSIVLVRLIPRNDDKFDHQYNQ